VIYEAQVIAVAFINVSKFSFAVFYLANLHDKKLIYTRRRHCQKEECIKKNTYMKSVKGCCQKIAIRIQSSFNRPGSIIGS